MFLHRLLPSMLVLLAAIPALAQGIDCGKPRGTVERGICASPRLLAQDAEMAQAYSRVTADPAIAGPIRTAQIAWIRAREAACGKLTDNALLEQCLSRFASARLAQLISAPSIPAAAPANPIANAVPIAPTSAPQLAAPAPVARPPIVSATAMPPEPLVAPLSPRISVSEAAATLDRTDIPAAERMETLLHVTQSGRFAIAAKSATGTALQLVDMLTGPTETMGLAGQKDGRIDVLLDVGTYKVRAFAAPGATGVVHFALTPFRDAAEATGLPVRGRLDTQLGDYQQLRFWLVVREGDAPRIEAAGRALADLRLFLNGTDLISVAPVRRVVEPSPGHPLSFLTLGSKVAPGVYEAIAYGGPPLTWTDGSTAQPFHLRPAVSDALIDGWTAGRIGPMGSEVFRTASQTGALRIDLPEPAPVTLQVAGGGTSVSVAKNSREPTAQIDLPTGENFVAISGSEGQPYRLRALGRAVHDRVGPPGSFWLTLSGRGFGGDEPPATGLMVRHHGDETPVVVASSGLRVGPGTGWRQRFNLRGAVTMLLNVTGPGKIAVHTDGVAVRTDIVPIGSPLRPRADGAPQTVWDLAAGWYVLGLVPDRNASGIIDLSVGPPDALPPAVMPSGPADPEPSFGLVAAGAGDVFDIYSGSAPGATGGFVIRPEPVDLTAGPLLASLPAGASLDVPVRLPNNGDAVASDVGIGPATASFTPVAGPTAGRIGIVHVDASDRARTMALGWRAPAIAPVPVPPPPAGEVLETLAAGQAHGFDLPRDTAHSFALDVAQGGLFRVETVGRLRTAGSIGTAFVPSLDTADANGIGQNFLIQRFLRAGRYRLAVTAHDSEGHLGVTARPASTVAGATLVPGGRVRARMASDSGVVFPVEIAKSGTYHLDLLSLGATLTARFEDEEGWPMLGAGDLSSLDQELRPGRYRLLVQPTGVAARLVARLTPITEPSAREGHGPFALTFDATQKHTWHEPAGRNDVRTPDSWVFALEGPARVKLSIGDEMVGDFLGPDGKVIARLTKAAPFDGALAAGRYRLEATSQGRNDRLDYTLALMADAIQPDVPRQVKLPGSVALAVAEERVVSLTSFGSVPVRAVLRRDDGSVVERFGEQADDWNIAVARRLPAGRYTLDLQSSASPTAVKVDAKDPTRAPEIATDPDQNADTENSADADGDSKDMSDEAASQPNTTADNSDNADSSSGDNAEAASAAKTIELRLALPPVRPAVTLNKGDTILFSDAGVHVLPLPQASSGSLLLASASSSAELALALERKAPGGIWQTVAVKQGTMPVVGAAGDDGDWRVSVWAVDGGSEPVRVAAQVVDAAPQQVGRVALADAALSGFSGIGVAKIGVPGASVLRVVGASSATPVEATSAPGRALSSVDGGMVVPQGGTVWLLDHLSGAKSLDLTSIVAPPGESVALAIPAAGDAMLPGAPLAAGQTRVWLARSGLGQPGLDAGHGMGVAAGSALALGSEGQVRVFNAGGPDPLRLSIVAHDLATQTARSLNGPLAEALPPHSVTPITLPEEWSSIRVDLAPGTAAIAGRDRASLSQDHALVTAWAGDEATSRVILGPIHQVLLVNTADHPSPVALGWTPLDEALPALTSGVATKRFYGAAGSIDFPADAKGRLLVAGGQATLVDAAGHVSRGASLVLDGAARVTIDHGPGLMAAWIEGADGRSPWPTPTPLDVRLPQRMAMRDAAMELRFDAASPMLLHARTTAPVILALGEGAPTMFPAGADFHQAVPVGEVRVRVISPHDGPLSGTIELDGEPITPATEGIGAEMAVAPGGSAAFGFEIARAGPVGVGVRAEPDRLRVRLLSADGKLLGEGVAQLQLLQPGRYVLEASVPPDATTTLLRPAIVGIAPHPNGPPPDVVNLYLALAGRAPVAVR